MKLILKKKHTQLALSILAILGTSITHAEMSETERLTTISSTVNVGLGMDSKDTQRINMFNGRDEKGAFLILDLDYVTRNDDTGTWTRVLGNNLGLDHRDIRLEYERQGDWGLSLEFNQMPHHNAFDVSTASTGLGTGAQTIPSNPAATPHTLTNFDLMTERDKVKVTGEKFFGEGFNLSFVLQSEKKEGNRQWGDGGFTLIDFLAEPISTETKQVDVKLGYVTKALQMEGGIYTTQFSNDILEVIKNPATSNQTHTLPPGNESTQIYVTGGYNFSKKTRGNFKVAMTNATQEENFVRAPSLNSRTNLGGEVDTKLMKLGLSTRPSNDLTLRSNIYYEDRDDKTPVVQYISTTATRTYDGFNVPLSRTTTKANIEANYRLDGMMRLIGGLIYDKREYSSPPRRSVSYRDETDETTIRIGLKTPLGENANGSFTLTQSDKGGSDYLPNAGGSPSDEIDPINWADRDRQKLQILLDWMASEKLSVQFIADTSSDEYDGRDQGPRDGSANLFSLDLSYALSDDYQLTGWISQEETEIDQVSSRSGTWSAKINSNVNSIGVGVRGNPTYKIKTGIDLVTSDDESKHELSAITTTDTADDLPVYYYKTMTLSLFVDYKLEENSDVRFVYGYDRIKTNDWSWSVDYVDANGNTVATVTQDPKDENHSIGISYRKRWF